MVDLVHCASTLSSLARSVHACPSMALALETKPRAAHAHCWHTLALGHSLTVSSPGRPKCSLYGRPCAKWFASSARPRREPLDRSLLAHSRGTSTTTRPATRQGNEGMQMLLGRRRSSAFASLEKRTRSSAARHWRPAGADRVMRCTWFGYGVPADLAEESVGCGG